MKTINISQSSSLAWLTKPIRLGAPLRTQHQWLAETYQVKVPGINLYSDLHSKSKHNVLILPTKSTNLNIARLVQECRKNGLKAWVLNPLLRIGSLAEFQSATNFIKEKPVVVACDIWYNIIQDSSKFDYALVFDPKVDPVEINEKILDENERKRNALSISNTKMDPIKIEAMRKELDSVQTVPEFKETSKKLFLYSEKKNDPQIQKMKHPGIINAKYWIFSEPLGSKELLVVKILKDYAGLTNFN